MMSTNYIIWSAVMKNSTTILGDMPQNVTGINQLSISDTLPASLELVEKDETAISNIG